MRCVSRFGVCRHLHGSARLPHSTFAVTPDHTAQHDVFCQDFDVPRVLRWNVDVHVHEKDVPSGARSCLARDPRCHVLSGCSSCLHPTTSCARSPVVSQHVEKSLASFARCLHDLKWQLQSIEQKRPEELVWNGELWCGRATRHRDACFSPPRSSNLGGIFHP